jgi:hypothetical protein
VAAEGDEYMPLSFGISMKSDLHASTIALLATQRQLLEDWLHTDDARQTAARLIRRRGLSRSADELISEAWLRIQRAFGRRDEPYPSIETSDDAARFAARVLDNLSRDWRRSDSRGSGVEFVEPDVPHDGGTSGIEERMLISQLLHVVALRATTDTHCPGCPAEVVAGTALEVLHLVLNGHDGGGDGRTWIDQVLYAALDRIDGDPDRTEAARAQRKSRCGRCVMALLEAGLRDLGEVAP